jgi:hypothetical protein
MMPLAIVGLGCGFLGIGAALLILARRRDVPLACISLLIGLPGVLLNASYIWSHWP